MITIIAGSRSITDPAVVKQAIVESGFEITEVVSGCACGVDRMGENWAVRNFKTIKRFPADWVRYGKAAGMVRNLEMVLYAQALIAIWDGTSSGAKHVISQAKKHGLKVFVKTIKGNQ